MKRRDFLQTIPALAATAALPACVTAPRPAGSDEREVMTVLGPIKARDMGITLTHEHLLANFQSWEEWSRAPRSYDRDEVVERVLPHLVRIRELGCRTFVDATAVGVGRDALLLRRLSQESGLHILVATGNYAAMQYKQLPPYVFTDSAEALAGRWVREWNSGIEGGPVRPGFIKLGFNGAALSPVEQKLIRAGAIAHRATGLTIGAHTGPAVAAFEELAVLGAERVDPSAWIWIHAQNEPELARHAAAARRGAWISFDGVRTETRDAHVAMVVNLRDQGLLAHALVSQDAGWYSVGQPDGGVFRSFDLLFTDFIPALVAKGFSQDEIDLLLVRNPAAAFAIRARTAG